jgi:5-methylcytosine-specific restriction endonuclease McrA
VENASTGILESQKLRCYNRGMAMNSRSLADLTDAQLLVEVKALAAGERGATVRLIAALAEVDARRLYLGEGFPSLFAYCTQCLRLAEHSAYNRIKVARLARHWPEVLERLADGGLTLTSICLLAPHLTADNHSSLLDSARYKSKREVEHLVAALQAQPDVPASIRRLMGAERPADVLIDRAQGGPSAPRPVVAPIAPERYKVQFTISRQTHDKLRRAQDLLRHTVPNGDPAEIFDRALTLLVTHLERTKLASVQRPRPPRSPTAASRYIPASVRRAVWARDRARCAFVGAQGRCAERGFLELHHVVPYSRGGAATEENIELRCRAHNQYEAAEVFGQRAAGAGQ